MTRDWQKILRRKRRKKHDKLPYTKEVVECMIRRNMGRQKTQFFLERRGSRLPRSSTVALLWQDHMIGFVEIWLHKDSVNVEVQDKTRRTVVSNWTHSKETAFLVAKKLMFILQQRQQYIIDMLR